jgi:hypothetical protein
MRSRGAHSRRDENKRNGRKTQRGWIAELRVGGVIAMTHNPAPPMSTHDRAKGLFPRDTRARARNDSEETELPQRPLHYLYHLPAWQAIYFRAAGAGVSVRSSGRQSPPIRICSVRRQSVCSDAVRRYLPRPGRYALAGRLQAGRCLSSPAQGQFPFTDTRRRLVVRERPGAVSHRLSLAQDLEVGNIMGRSGESAGDRGLSASPASR